MKQVGDLENETFEGFVFLFEAVAEEFAAVIDKVYFAITPPDRLN